MQGVLHTMAGATGNLKERGSDKRERGNPLERERKRGDLFERETKTLGAFQSKKNGGGGCSSSAWLAQGEVLNAWGSYKKKALRGKRLCWGTRSWEKKGREEYLLPSVEVEFHTLGSWEG